jgi:hypothetical protein
VADLTVPTDVQQSTKRGRRRMLKGAPARRLCTRFERGDTYHYIDSKNLLNQQSTVTNPNGSGKPPHRIRNKYNFIRPIVEAKLSAATQRVPSYEITPTTTDPTVISAASLSERVALYGYDQWRLRNVTLKTVKLAIAGGGDGFALPYFDPNVGPYTEVDGQMVGRGEIKILVLSGNEVYWEAGADFEQSRWYAIERARPLEDVKETPGFTGGALSPDASSSDIPSDRDSHDNLVMVTEYFERPCPKWPDGRTITIANNRPIVDYRQVDPTSPAWWGPYPLQDATGVVLDEPLLHRLSYTVDSDKDQDFGLVWQLIDFQRTAQDCVNKLLEWKNRCLNPQMIAIVGSIVTPPDDVPGSVRYVRNIGGMLPQWEKPPQIPGELFQILEWATNAMAQIAADQQVDPAPNLAARTLEAGIEQSQNRWQSFLGDLAEWHSRLMRHCLMLVERYYSEQRLLQLRGRDGWELIQDFRGAQLMGQSQVRVLPGSITPITRAGIQDQLTWINQNWPGFINPEAAIAALQAGTLERLTQSYWLDVGRANVVVQKICDGSVMEMPTRQDTMPDGTTVPDTPTYMPGPADNLNVWKQIFSDFMKTDTFERLPEPLQEVTNQVWSGIQYLEQQKAAQDAAQQAAIAGQLGMQNAAKPQAKGMPSLPGSSTVPAAH